MGRKNRTMVGMTDDLFTHAEQARDAAMDRVLSRTSLDWKERALGEVANLPSGERLTGEQIRHHIEAVVGSPHHHNAWGAIIAVAVKRGQIKPTGEWTKMRDVQSHARKTPVYRVA